MMLSTQKHLFSLKDTIHYLNCAYKSPLLKTSEDELLKAVQKERNPINFTPNDFFEDTEIVRQLFGTLVNCNAKQVAVIPSTSYGLASVLNNISYTTGQQVITVENEFPSDYYSIKRWCDTHNAELKIIKPNAELKHIGENWNTKLINAINHKTAIVNISSVHWMTGLKFDLEAIGKKCKSVNAKFIVDGTQSVGALPIDIKKYNIDALICASYKWLMGPYAMGLMYISSEFNNGIPLEESWMNRTNARNFKQLTNYTTNYGEGAMRYNVGQTSNFISMPILKSGLEQITRWTPKAIQNYCEDLIVPLRNYLQNLGLVFEHSKYFSNHIVGFTLPSTINIDLLIKQLEAHRVYLSVRSTSLRVSVNVFNTTKDIEKLITVIELTKK